MRYLFVIGGFWAFAFIVYALMEWAVPAIYSGTPNAPSGFNYGTSFVVPFSRTFAPWIAGIIAAMGLVVVLRSAIAKFGTSRRREVHRRG